VTIIVGDCREVMAGMAEASVDAIVTDPPYGLSREPDVAEVMRHWLAGDTYEHGGGGFMGRTWDSFVPGPDYWREAFRVLKPGGYCLAFGGTRTFDLLSIAMRLAGFQVRDVVCWLQGAGFPKSLDVSKAIDKRRVDDVRPVCRFLADHMGTYRITDIVKALGFAGNGDHGVSAWFREDHVSPRVPTWTQWLELKALLGFGDEMDAEVWRLNGRKGQPGEAWHEREVIGQSSHKSGIGNATDGHYTVGGTKAEHYTITAPATPEAEQWAGWGTALKPAWEPVIVARKPLGKSGVAANVLAHGTGALNIDACRIATDDRLVAGGGKGRLPGDARTGAAAGIFDGAPNTYEQHTEGRWPANVCLDEAAAEMLDEMSGERRLGGSPRSDNNRNQSNGHGYDYGSPMFKSGQHYGDSGGASRFFYCAKSSRRERNAGLEGMPERETQQYGSIRSERGNGYDESSKHTNHHPTVKPIALMRWLVRLVTPPGGLVLDPFAGSGSTGCACVLEGFDFIGIEADAEYAAIAERRIAFWRENGDRPVKAAKPERAGNTYANGKGRRMFPRCPEHDATLDKSQRDRFYKCSCRSVYGDYTALSRPAVLQPALPLEGAAD
jgi:DNA modification methylase